ncbi:hypothetical protein E3J79_03015 [Candidatus Dependentiae bacterium]|nr:MAG: hypothetical protein E3J79_03015 [Candidatus Dependentiae bacterium]
MMLDNTHYNKMKILHRLSKTAWFIKKCAKKDAKEAGHMECLKQYEELEKDLSNHIDKLYDSLCKSCMSKK